MKILIEIYQFLFISSIIFMIYVFGNLILRMYGKFILNENTQFVLTKFEKIMLWISLTIFFSYIF
jgi:hypothetical protein